MDTGSFPGVKCGRGVLLTTHPLLVPRSWKSRTITLPTIWATLGLDWTWIYHLPERKHVVLRCWKDTAWTSSTHILYENGVVYSTSQCLLTTDKFQILPDIIGNTQATIDPTKLFVPDQVAIVANHGLQALEEAIPPEIAQLDDVRSRVAIPR